MKKRLFSLFVAIVMIVSILGSIPVVAAGPKYLAFTSDIHNTGAATSNDTGANNLTNWLANIPGKIGGTFDTMGFCGDNGNSNTNGDSYWSLVQTVMDVVSSSSNVADDGFFVNGNHEFQNGSQGNTNNETAKKFKNVGDKKVTDDYVIYAFGATSTNQSFNQSDITNLDNYLKNVAKTMPVFVMSHFPLHYDSNRTTSNAQALLDVLNKYPNVIFLWGHNHTTSDPHYDNVYLAGDTIKLESRGSEKEINFTYAAAGCMGNTSYAHAVQADGLVAKVDGSAVTLTYYSGSASVVGSAVTVDVSTGSGTVTPTPDPDPTPDAPEADGTFTKATKIEAGKTYVITAAGMGMNGTAHSGYVNSSNYAYSGFAGTAVTASNDKITSTVTKDMLWTAESVSGGFAFKNENNGQYLAAFYEGQNGDNGIKFSTTAEAWTLSSSKLKSVTASSSASSDKFLAWDTDSDVNGGINNASGTANLFTVRSSSNADNVTLYVANGNVDVEDPTPDTPVTPDPDPDPTPTPDADGTFTKVSSIENGKTYVIVAENMGMNATAHAGYVNSTSYGYSGFAGTAVTASNNKITSTVTEDMLWTAESVNGGFAFKNASNGKYLSAFYVGRGDNGIEFSTTAQAWTLSSSKLKSVTASSSASSDKFLAWDTDSDVNGGINSATGTANLFTIRSNDNADNVTLYVANGNVDVEDPTPDTPVTPDPTPDPTPTPDADGTFTKVTSIEDGKTYVITAAGMGMNATVHTGYTNCNSSSNYKYIGFNGTAVTVSGDKITSTVTTDMLWTAEAVNGGFAFKNASNGQYLAGFYAGSNAENGIRFSTTADAWTLSNSKLKSVTASSSASSDKFLAWDTDSDVNGGLNASGASGSANLFTVRSNNNADNVTLYVASENVVEPNPPVEPEVPVYTVSGTVTSFYGETDNVTVALLNGNDEVVYSTTVTGNNATYTINNVAAGEYTLRVSNTANVTRVYAVVVVDANVTQDAELYMLGDANGDGKVNVGDYNAVYYHVLGSALITDEFALMCADVNGDGSITLVDANMIFNHALGTEYLW